MTFTLQNRDPSLVYPNSQLSSRIWPRWVHSSPGWNRNPAGNTKQASQNKWGGFVRGSADQSSQKPKDPPPHEPEDLPPQPRDSRWLDGNGKRNPTTTSGPTWEVHPSPSCRPPAAWPGKGAPSSSSDNTSEDQWEPLG